MGFQFKKNNISALNKLGIFFIASSVLLFWAYFSSPPAPSLQSLFKDWKNATGIVVDT